MLTIFLAYEFLRRRLIMPRLRTKRFVDERTHHRNERTYRQEIGKPELEMLDAELEEMEVEEEEDYREEIYGDIIKEEEDQLQKEKTENESIFSRTRNVGLALSDLKKQHKGRIEDLIESMKHHSIDTAEYLVAKSLEHRRYIKDKRNLIMMARARQYKPKTRQLKPKMYDALQHRDVPLPSLFRVGKMEHACPHCGALFWLNERLK